MFKLISIISINIVTIILCLVQYIRTNDFVCHVIIIFCVLIISAAINTILKKSKMKQSISQKKIIEELCANNIKYFYFNKFIDKWVIVYKHPIPNDTFNEFDEAYNYIKSIL